MLLVVGLAVGVAASAGVVAALTGSSSEDDAETAAEAEVDEVPLGGEPSGSEEPEAKPELEPSPEAPTPEPAADYDAQELAERFGDAVWQVEAEGCDAVFTGTAFAVSETQLVTNWHVTSVTATPTLRSRDGQQQMDATVVGWSVDPDVALLEVDAPLDLYLDWMDADELAFGQSLVALGYPAPDGEFTVTPATIMSFQTDGGRREAIRADGLLDKGNSGGPALTSSGQVAGVATEMEFTGGFQLIPLIYTHDHLRDELASIEDDAAGVEVDCAQAGLLPELPEDWEAWTPPEPEDQPWGYGDDAELDALWDACAEGDWVACDDLYWRSAVGSEYEAFGGSCGEQAAAYGICEWVMDDAYGAPDVPPSTQPAGQAHTYGDDSELDALWDACADADWAACDQLWAVSPFDSEYEQFGATCGQRDEPSYGACWRRDQGS